MSLRRLVRKAAALLRRPAPDDARATALHAWLGDAPTAPTDARPRVAVQFVEDTYYLGVFATLTRALRAADGAAPALDLVVTRSFEAGLRGGWASFAAHTLLLNRLLSRQWASVYRAVSDRVAYRSTSLHPVADIVALWRAASDWRAIRATGVIDGYRIDGIECGDLVIDSYLRFRPAPQFRPDDAFVLYLLWQARRDVHRARGYFDRVKPQVYLTSYTTYIQHGVAARVALQAGTRVWSFGNFQQLGKLLDRHDSFHTRNPLHYRRDFARLPAPDALVDEARRQLEARLGGGIDAATAYMGASAYAKTRDDVPDVRGAVVVFLHDFYDSPHVYGDMVFPDFWSWICFTLETLEAAGIRHVVKPHPNQIALSGRVIEALRERFPSMELVPAGITNRQLVDAGMACAVTVYGTVAHEMAYLGVPSIGCARHPHIAFDFCRTAHDRAGYAALLRGARRVHPELEAMRRQALEFYVMHNLSLPADDLAVRDAMVATWKSCLDPSRPAAEVIARFEALAALPGFAALARRMMTPPASTRPMGSAHTTPVEVEYSS